MSVRNKIKTQLELEREYTRIAENEMIYYDEFSLWKRLTTVTSFLGVFSFCLLFTIFLVPQNELEKIDSIFELPELFPHYPLQVSAFCVSIVLLIVSIAANQFFQHKSSKVQEELGLHREEHLYLHAYETRTNIDSFLTESNPKRKLYFKKLALKSAKELTATVEGLKYGNVRLVANLIGDKIDLLKDNVRRLILSNVAKGDDEALKKASKSLMEFCKYIHSPSIEKLEELNNMMGEIPFKEYKYLTKKERVSGYFYGRPRIFRLIFASVVTITVVAVLWCMEQNWGLVIAVGVTCFWGSFSGFDKLFRVKEK